MKSYCDHRGEPADFRVSYRFFSPDEVGHNLPPQQHTRWDFMYFGDDMQRDGMYMIWPEFLSPDGMVLPAGEVPLAGFADMYVLFPESRPYHSERMRVGTDGYFMEGPNKVASCSIVAILGLHDNPRSS